MTETKFKKGDIVKVKGTMMLGKVITTKDRTYEREYEIYFFVRDTTAFYDTDKLEKASKAEAKTWRLWAKRYEVERGI
jgi:hypothetical protein